ncbi:glycosyltransferase family 2 protein [Oceanidesulfovibrio indonesiensis]|uniref:Glycosyltransferase family 2 protein n=1 Tax=Oceanidesulfovibrio indonesiensis TaxID=54767 RepID=A0A7M3MDL2_9BACT|nr:glycosyltransferase [Oceanidesulfovibrio indonesiensis]TVM16361.1 glycosyltransferase family 2 protein [Oceanidesulfovibrio indonesiensis]
MNQPPAVSVLLPVRNAAPTLPRALDSLLAQSHADIEIVAVDDGSTDETPAILRRAAAADPRIVVESIPPLGLVPALNRGLELCRSDLVARMDGDDVCQPDRLAKQKELLDERPGLGVASCLVLFGGDAEASAGYAFHVDWCNNHITEQDIALHRFQESPLPHPSVMFRKSIILDAGGYRDGAFPEDYELWLRLMDRGVRIAKVPEFLLTWSDPPDRLSRVDARYDVDAFYAVKAQYLARWLERENPFHPAVTIIGAGRVSRKRADLLEAHGVSIEAYVDIDPRKVGKAVHGRPVIHRDELGGPGSRFAVSYVASRGAASDIEEFLQARGWVAGRDYILAA